MEESKTKENNECSLSSLAQLAGLPVELVKKELFEDSDQEEFSLENIREAMTRYLDKTMITK